MKQRAVIKEGHSSQLQWSQIFGRLKQGLLEVRSTGLAWTTDEDHPLSPSMPKKGGSKKGKRELAGRKG